MFSIKSKYSKALLCLKYVEYMYRFFTLNFFTRCSLTSCYYTSTNFLILLLPSFGDY